MENQHGADEAQFTVRLDSVSAQQNLYCCLYKDRHGLYSAFSQYLPLDHQQGLFASLCVFVCDKVSQVYSRKLSCWHYREILCFCLYKIIRFIL